MEGPPETLSDVKVDGLSVNYNAPQADMELDVAVTSRKRKISTSDDNERPKKATAPEEQPCCSCSVERSTADDVPMESKDAAYQPHDPQKLLYEAALDNFLNQYLEDTVQPDEVRLNLGRIVSLFMGVYEVYKEEPLYTNLITKAFLGDTPE